jgi:DNA uptake protein ComE-like DNA-binding protein
MIAAHIPAAARAVAVPLLLLAAAACGGSADRASDSAVARDSAAAPTPTAAATSDTTTVASGGETAVQGALLDPNTATRAQLLAVPGVADHVADAIIAGRPYADMRAVNKVLLTHAPDSAARKAIYQRVWKPIDLNSASDEEILLIPGIGRRMLHEFKEYRPYTSIEQFRREIGKYVDKAEVARLERYVAIKK